MSHIPPEWSSYWDHVFHRLNKFHPLPEIPGDWALHTINLASEWVEQQYMAHLAGRPLIPPPPELDVPTILACGQLAFLLAEAYRNPIQLDISMVRYNEALTKRETGMNDVHEESLLARFPPAEKMLLTRPLVVLDSGYRIIIWYVLEALNGYIQSDMYTATLGMSHHLRKSVTHGASQWRTNGANFHATDGADVTPRCINIAPCWFQQGREGTPPENTWGSFMPEVSATLKGERGMSMILQMQRPGLLASAVMCVMHPQQYWASIRTHIELGHWAASHGFEDMYQNLKHWASIYTGVTVMCNRLSPYHKDPKCPPEGFNILTSIRSYRQAMMHLINLGIDIAYDPGVMVGYSGRLVRHGVRVDEGDRIIWAWFVRDSIHNYTRTPRPEYAKYSPLDLDMYEHVKYNQADFVRYGTLGLTCPA
ncbi:uncharacterized protein F5891DRAFT_1187832 [Suillus fuscotomentosus]|uniref:Uncharacterized protein n=1 Tax=Suillus fuscotomentosus TaxID=1912939 RepID=A0AAD4HM15_9AGAM|nr:uncharacterized protein F5891DRAFT_1187832 [Suillus fuscotomentosus]KAG1901136.1 hypothetical protein F5891DRAFT_1187832 [Suillus fuscotomentosus]